MTTTQNWLDLLGWGQAELEDLRFVGFAYIKQGKYDIALTFFEALLFLSKEEPYDLQTLGALYLQMGNNLAALNFLERAIKVAPDHDPTLLNRVKALFLLGYRHQALEQAKTLIASTNQYVSNQASALVLAYS
jgi:tetratricopeptide (TPR) repeat protein